jgi:D-alanyl-D-alanine carboxypeptidase
MTRALLVLLLLLGQVPVAAARTRAVQHPAAYVPPAAIVAAAHQAAGNAMAVGVPAVQIAVYQGDRIIYSEAFGVVDTQSQTAATPRSVMQAGSVTKQFTAAGILRLAERGLLSLDDPIEKHVTDFDPRGVTLTLRRLLSHTSGVRRDWMDQPGPGLLEPATREEVIQSLNQAPYDFAPGKKWSYSNAGYALLGFAIESITGKSFPQFIHDEFALPLGLIDTGVCGSFNLPVPAGYGLVPGWPLLEMQPLHPTVLLAGGSLCSTATDLARWAHLLATGYVMLPESYATMITPARLENGLAAPDGYALGVFTRQTLGRPAVWHGGDVDGFKTFLLYFPEEDLAVAAMTNAFPAPSVGAPSVIATAVAKGALGATSQSSELADDPVIALSSASH